MKVLKFHTLCGLLQTQPQVTVEHIGANWSSSADKTSSYHFVATSSADRMVFMEMVT